MNAKLYLLRALKPQGYDSACGFVVSASTPKKARQIASLRPGHEGPEFWLDKTRSTCRDLRLFRGEGIVLRDFDAA